MFHFEESKKLFNRIANANIDMRIKKEPRGIVTANLEKQLFSGIVSRLEASYCFIKRDKYQDTIFSYKTFSEEVDWQSLSFNQRVSFYLAFNFRGAFAVNLSNEKSI